MSHPLACRVTLLGEEGKKLGRQLEEKGAIAIGGEAGIFVLPTRHAKDFALATPGVAPLDLEEDDPVGRDVLCEANR